MRPRSGRRPQSPPGESFFTTVSAALGRANARACPRSILRDMRTDIVAAGIVIEHGKVLLSRRKKGSHLAGLWEFPGGKAEAGEDPRAALRRELEEELGIRTRIGEIVEVTFHRYDDADKAVLLLFFEAVREEGSPEARAIDVAEVAWRDVKALAPETFPPADVAVLAKVRARLEAL